MKVLTVVGARPQFIKAFAVSKELRAMPGVKEVLVHTGQHYDVEMSQVFFDELGIPAPDYNLEVGSSTHGFQTAEMLAKLESIMTYESPDVVLVYGDTNSTLSGALAAAKMNVPLAHVEAGLRSFNRRMPEEINRIVADHLAELHFCPSETAVGNLGIEGISAGVVMVGDVMLDTARHFSERQSPAAAAAMHGLEPGEYVLATVHRAGNTDDPARLRAILVGLAASELPVLFPVHPRTRAAAEREGLVEYLSSASLKAVSPLPYTEMMALLRGASALATDSGGMQKEAYFFSVPCLTLRDETEWQETVSLGWNRLVPADADAIKEALAAPPRGDAHPDLYGDGYAGRRVAETLVEKYQQ
jgi:UDP-GlcNAc3NAcA epimerase